MLVLFATARPNGIVAEELERLASDFSDSLVMGCSTAGGIFNDRLSDQGIVAALLSFEHTSRRLMRANFDRLIDGAALAGESLRADDIDGPGVCIATSCVGRRLLLGSRVEEELEAVRDSLPQNIALLGYYSYGEISPLASGRSDLHNQTMTLTILTED